MNSSEDEDKLMTCSQNLGFNLRNLSGQDKGRVYQMVHASQRQVLIFLSAGLRLVECGSESWVVETRQLWGTLRDQHCWTSRNQGYILLPVPDKVKGSFLWKPPGICSCGLCTVASLLKCSHVKDQGKFCCCLLLFPFSKQKMHLSKYYGWLGEITWVINNCPS